MARSLRSRLWLGYLLLTILVLGAFLLGLVYLLNGSTVLYRQAVTKLENTQENILRSIANSPQDKIEKIKTVVSESSLDGSIRVVITSNLGATLYDSKQDQDKSLRWLRFTAIRRVALQSTSGFTRDATRKVWIFVAAKIPDSQNYIVVASQRQNLTWKFMFSDPMTKLVLRVVVWAMIVSFLLTLLMDRWIARPIRQMANQAGLLATKNGSQLPVEGVKEVQDLALALNKMSRQVHESQQSQRDFISDVSHELKTPLTSIQGFSTAILDGTASKPEEIHHAVKIITEESQRMLGLVNELLRLARLEGKVEQLDKHPTNLQELLNGVLEKMKPLAELGQVKLLSSISNLPIVDIDSEKITQVFLNLVENAIKFSPEGGEVNVSGESMSDEIKIHITDMGNGIPEEEIAKIFNRFYQVDRARKGGSGKSSGLGLTIAREIIRSHHGEISVASTIGKGTIFTVHIPLNLKTNN